MVVLVVDALGANLAAGAPGFAPGLTHRRRLDTILGFSSGALPTLFTGRFPEEHGRFLMYRRAQAGDTPFRSLGWTRALPPRLARSWRLRQWIARRIGREVRGYFNLYEVPLGWLPEFDLPERADIFAPGGLPGGSWYDTLAASGVTWRGWDWRTREDEAFAALERALADGTHDVLTLYTADLDALLHREGSRGAGVRERLGRYTARLAGLADLAARRGEALWVYLMSDHGMVDVTRTVDPFAALAPLGIAAPRDALWFLDSTFARFWWRDRAVRERVRRALDAMGGGRWLGDDDLARERVRFGRHEYGDDLFLCDPGVLLVPSFMGRAPVAAMHGYDPAHPDMAAILWSNRPLPEDLRHIAGVRAHLERELGRLRAEAA